MESTIASLPAYLRTYVVTQDEDKYSSRDHASWRYIMRQSRAYFKDHAVPIYLKGLEFTGITLDRIPRISDMDAKLKRLGWGAVPVCGFIPPAAFLDFQARRILPIAFDMRNVNNIAYTPAPDIVHEAAGHAPIIADEQYSQYLTMYAQMAQKAIFSREDLELYEAIRTLSDVKENPDSSKEIIERAEASLERAAATLPFVSEANKVARMNWWTVEYGLLGSLENPKIYGAGLLSSVGESQNCLSPKVKKIPLSVACVETTYDITEPQPQLFVAEDVSHLVSVLKEFEATLAFKRGGVYGLLQAKDGRTVTTTVLDSGVQISGRLEDFKADGETVEFIRYGGPVQLACHDAELPGQGTGHHPLGFSSPLGRLKSLSDRPMALLSDEDLKKAGLHVGRKAQMALTTGFMIDGYLHQITRREGKIVLMSWKGCTVSRGSEVFFQPAWGDFDMAIGERVVSVCGGPADRAAFPIYETGKASTSPARMSPFSPKEQAAFSAYSQVRAIRDTLKTNGKGAYSLEETVRLAEEFMARFPDEWLLLLEVLEIFHTVDQGPSASLFHKRIEAIGTHLRSHGQKHGTTQDWLIQQGLGLLATPD